MGLDFRVGITIGVTLRFSARVRVIVARELECIVPS